MLFRSYRPRKDTLFKTKIDKIDTLIKTKNDKIDTLFKTKIRKTYPGWPHVPIKPLVREYPGPPGHKHSYNSAYNSESDSVTCENQPFLKQTHVPSQVY